MKCAGSNIGWVGDRNGAVCATCGQGWRKLGVKRPREVHLRGGGSLWQGVAPDHDKPPARRNQGGRRVV
jgi:hypothetical protein